MYLEIFLADFAVFRVFGGISRDFAEIPKFRGSATARNIRSPVPKYQRDKLKRIQNTAARLVMNSKHLNQATRLLKNLHWLPVETGIEFKIFLLTYKTINGQSAGYLKP